MPLLLRSRFLSWRFRSLLNLLPARAPVGRFKAGVVNKFPGPCRIAYLFSGTYGDFVQCLVPLQTLAKEFPNAEIILYGAERNAFKFASEFASELPPNLRVSARLELGLWFLNRVDLLFTNSVGVYRVHFDYLARFGAGLAFGFRHRHELRRGGFNGTRALDEKVKNFAVENLQLLALAGIKIPSGSPSPLEPAEAPWGQGKILLHIGSAGLKKDFGLKLYSRLILELLQGLKDEAVEIIMGPGDDDIATEVRSGMHLEPRIYPLSELVARTRSFQGQVLAFNSFFAHLCHYLSRPAIVIHRQAIPYGYDCSPLHRQVVLMAEKNWDLAEVWNALGQKMGKDKSA